MLELAILQYLMLVLFYTPYLVTFEISQLYLRGPDFKWHFTKKKDSNKWHLQNNRNIKLRLGEGLVLFCSLIKSNKFISVRDAFGNFRLVAILLGIYPKFVSKNEIFNNQRKSWINFVLVVLKVHGKKKIVRNLVSLVFS